MDKMSSTLLAARMPAGLMLAAGKGNVKAVSTWLDDGGQVDATCDSPFSAVQDVTMLMIASSYGQASLVEHVGGGAGWPPAAAQAWQQPAFGGWQQPAMAGAWQPPAFDPGTASLAGMQAWGLPGPGPAGGPETH